MQKLFLKLSSSVLVLSAAVAICGCGKSEKKVAESPAPSRANLVPSLTAEERANYCFIFTDPETNNQDRETFLSQLNGVWTHIPTRTESNAQIKRFTFLQERRYVAISDAINMFRENLTYKKVCVSKALGADSGDFEGYRIVELMAENNEGGVAFAAKFEAPSGTHDYPTLNMSQRLYMRWAATSPLISVSSMLKSNQVFAYPNRE